MHRVWKSDVCQGTLDGVSESDLIRFLSVIGTLSRDLLIHGIDHPDVSVPAEVRQMNVAEVRLERQLSCQRPSFKK